MRLEANENHIGKVKQRQTFGWASCKELKFFNHLTGDVAKNAIWNTDPETRMHMHAYMHTRTHTCLHHSLLLFHWRWIKMVETADDENHSYSQLIIWKSLAISNLCCHGLGNPSINSYAFNIHCALCTDQRELIGNLLNYAKMGIYLRTWFF